MTTPKQSPRPHATVTAELDAARIRLSLAPDGSARRDAAESKVAHLTAELARTPLQSYTRAQIAAAPRVRIASGWVDVISVGVGTVLVDADGTPTRVGFGLVLETAVTR